MDQNEFIAFLRHIRHLIKSGKTEEAILKLEEAIPDEPDDTESPFLLGLRYHHTGNWDEAIAAFEKAVEQEPTAAGNWYWLGG